MQLHGLGLDLTGWFQIGWSVDVPDRGVVPMRWFGVDLVAWRTVEGRVVLQDRYCQHLGASLAHGGVVGDGGIQCPFHGWTWNAQGGNVAIPYQERPNKARKLRTWTVDERNESLYLWHDPGGRTPLWEVPDALSAGVHVEQRSFLPLTAEARSRFSDLRVHPQMVAENAVDAQHFRFVHRTPQSPVVLEERVEGPVWWSRVGFGKGWTEHRHDDRGLLRTDSLYTIEVLWSGLGVSVTTEHTKDGVRVISVNTTPVEDGRTELFASYWIDEESGDPERRLAEAKAAVPDDLRIWNNQTYLDPPGLATEEGRGFRQLRRWADQFYDQGRTQEERQEAEELRMFLGHKLC